MDQIPGEMIEDFIRRSKFRDIHRLCRTNKRFYELCRMEPMRRIINLIRMRDGMSAPALADFREVFCLYT